MALSLTFAQLQSAMQLATQINTLSAAAVNPQAQTVMVGSGNAPISYTLSAALVGAEINRQLSDAKAQLLALGIVLTP